MTEKRQMARHRAASPRITTDRGFQDGMAIVCRFEPTGRPRRTTLSLPFVPLRTKVKLGGFEIKTLRINPQTKQVTETDLLEQPLSGAKRR